MSVTAIRRAVAVVAAVTVAVTGLPAPAFAAGDSKVCRENTCYVRMSFPGGTISVDADVSGTRDGNWKLWRTEDVDSPRCQVTFPAAGGVRSWTCNVPAGTMHAQVWGTGVTKIGIRW